MGPLVPLTMGAAALVLSEPPPQALKANAATKGVSSVTAQGIQRVGYECMADVLTCEGGWAASVMARTSDLARLIPEAYVDFSGHVTVCNP